MTTAIENILRTPISRRSALRAATAAVAAPALTACSDHAMAAIPTPIELVNAITDFGALEPNTTSALVRAELPGNTWIAAYSADRQVFVGSAIKTFILGQFLRDSEVSRNGITEDSTVEISDLHRSPGGGVYEGLTGTAHYRSVLEAMITHSDNTATDIAIAQAEPARVRALIAEAGLRQTQIPDSTRSLMSYLAGAPVGVDLGWNGIQNLDATGYTKRTDAINPDVSMLSSATDMVHWYEQALSGKFFRDAATLKEFKRISAMADAMARVVPDDTVAYGKGGSIDWAGFHCITVAGQMRVRDIPVTFCFALNWNSDAVDTRARTAAFLAPVVNALAAVATSIKRLYSFKS